MGRCVTPFKKVSRWLRGGGLSCRTTMFGAPSYLYLTTLSPSIQSQQGSLCNEIFCDACCCFLFTEKWATKNFFKKMIGLSLFQQILMVILLLLIVISLISEGDFTFPGMNTLGSSQTIPIRDITNSLFELVILLYYQNLHIPKSTYPHLQINHINIHLQKASVESCYAATIILSRSHDISKLWVEYN